MLGTADLLQSADNTFGYSGSGRRLLADLPPTYGRCLLQVGPWDCGGVR